jgi:RHS repeat-associated protein
VYTNGVPNGRMLEESNTYCSRISPIRCHAIIKQFGILVVYIVYTRADSRVSRLAKSGKAFKQFSMPPTRSSNALDISCDAPNAPNFRVFSDINVCVLRSKTKLPGPVGVTVVPPMMARRKHHPGIQINYPGSGNYSQFTCDGLGQSVEIEEYSDGSVSGTKQFVWCGIDRCETRNSSGTITGQFFAMGETIGGTGYFYTAQQPGLRMPVMLPTGMGDHRPALNPVHFGGSIMEMTNSTGSITAQYVYDPYGRPRLLQGSVASDRQFAGYYFHAPSGLSLSQTRAYNAALGRWINRDPAGEFVDTNLYAYVDNRPTMLTDPSGLAPADFCHYYCRRASWELYWSCIGNGGDPCICLGFSAAAYTACYAACRAGWP